MIRSTVTRLFGLTLALAGAGCAQAEDLPAASRAEFDPVAFFMGRSEGEGSLDTMVASPVRIRVQSVGRKQGDMLVLDQSIRQGDKPPRVRRWTMRRVGPGRFTGSLSDAKGPASVTVSGPRAVIRYTMKNGFKVEQRLALQSDGKTLLNRMKVTMLGVQVATLQETIRKLD